MLALLALPLIVPLAPALRDPAPWAQPVDAPAAALFKRSTPDPSASNFSSYYPPASGTPANTTVPSAWLSALAALALPNVSVSTQDNGYPTYPGGASGADATICSFTYECTVESDLYEPPAGVYALTFDDGPTDASPELISYLAENNISSSATHFLIGGNVLSAPQTAQDIFNGGGHMAVHTWSHPYMTTLSNEDVVAELGWTMQIISDLTGGRLPAYWRPPYGDVDNRVRAIAKGVFGLETVVWNQDSADWAVGTDPAYTTASVEASMTSWLTGNKSAGICALEHELSNTTVGIFQDMYPVMAANNWSVRSVPDAFARQWYQNAAGNAGAVSSTMSVGQINTALSVSATSTATSTSTGTGTSTSASASSSAPASSASTSASTSTSTSAATGGAAAASASASASAGSSTSGAIRTAGVGVGAALLAAVPLALALALL
ncbi:hypothetical protein Q5752_002336 [Cryptotrichosporon argae]